MLKKSWRIKKLTKIIFYLKLYIIQGGIGGTNLLILYPKPFPLRVKHGEYMKKPTLLSSYPNLLHTYFLNKIKIYQILKIIIKNNKYWK